MSAGRALAGAGILLLVAAAWWIVSLPPFSAAATVAVVGAGAGAACAGLMRRRPGCVSRARARILPWFAVVAAASAWQLAAYLQHPRAEHPTLSLLANALLDSQVTRTAAFLLWLLGAVELARR